MPGRAPKNPLAVWLAFAVLYALAGAVALSLEPPAKGWAVLACSIAGCVGLVIVCRLTGSARGALIAGMVIPISVFQVLPDWFLVEGLGTLRFDQLGGPRIDDALPLAMAGLWALPLFVVCIVARDRLWAGAAAGLAVFAATEIAAPTVGIWEPVGASTVLGAAIYVLPAEAALGAATVYAVRVAGKLSLAQRLLPALAVSILYTGALAISWLLVDGAG